MRNLFGPYLVPLPRDVHASPSHRKRITRCPACGALGTLKVAKGMILCTQCFWATALQQQAG